MPRSKKTERERHKERGPRKIQLEIDQDLKQYLRDKSVEFGIPQSQIVEFLVILDKADALDRNVPLSRYLEPSDSPKWRYKLNKARLRRDLGLD
jgi:hypothetical protein